MIRAGRSCRGPLNSGLALSLTCVDRATAGPLKDSCKSD